jgi:hypothetical protein
MMMMVLLVVVVMIAMVAMVMVAMVMNIAVDDGITLALLCRPKLLHLHDINLTHLGTRNIVFA